MYKKPFSQRFLVPAIIMGLIAVLCSVGYAKGWIDIKKNDQTLSQPYESDKNDDVIKTTEKVEEPNLESAEVKEETAQTSTPVPAPAPSPAPTTPPKSSPAPTTSAPKVTTTPKTTSTSTPPPVRTPASSSTAPVAASGEVQAILSAINSVRQQNGLTSVALNSKLNSAALAKSQDMYNNNYFAHTSPAGVSDFNFVVNSGYRYRQAGVNLAKGDFGSAQGLVDAWMGSSGHRANLLADFGRELGIGIAGQYYTMIIAQPM